MTNTRSLYRFRHLLMLALLLASFLPPPAVHGEATVPPHQVFLPLMLAPPDPFIADKREVIRLVNEQRNAAGCSAAVEHQVLMQAAQVWADNMGTTGVFEHSPMGWYQEHGYPWDASENIGGGTPESVVRNWMQSEGHRRTLLLCDYPNVRYDVGVGYGRLGWVFAISFQ